MFNNFCSICFGINSYNRILSFTTCYLWQQSFMNAQAQVARHRSYKIYYLFGRRSRIKAVLSKARHEPGLTISSGDAMTLPAAGLSSSIANGIKFTTFDVDNDQDSSQSCARTWHGSWWYNNCFAANLNGRYNKVPTMTTGKGIVWYQWHGWEYSLKTTKMIIQKN